AAFAVAGTFVACSAGEGKPLAVKPGARVNPQTAAALKLAIADYNQGKYKDAVVKLEDVDKNGLCNDRTHYNIALCYQCMNQTVLAKMHYLWVLKNGSDPTLKAYSQSEYSQIANYQSHRTYDGQGNTFAASSNSHTRPMALVNDGFPPGFS